MRNFFKNKKGFTLIELVVVIAILGILAGLAIPRFMDATATARGARIVADMRTIDSAIMIYNAKTGSLPSNEDDLTENDPDNKKHKLLAAWPAPPQGTAKVTTITGKEKTITVAADAVYTLNATEDDDHEGRAELDEKTVDEILKD